MKVLLQSKDTLATSYQDNCDTYILLFPKDCCSTISWRDGHLRPIGKQTILDEKYWEKTFRERRIQDDWVMF